MQRPDARVTRCPELEKEDAAIFITVAALLFLPSKEAYA